ncbi:MAG: hypothetical protein GJ680_12375 [Alteromonadaceae bacterium]|nr:hypothetical protein [Alteromonadaceae bacterium]
MNHEKMTKAEAASALQSLDNAQQELIRESTPPVWIRLIMSLSFGSIFFGYGMTEHENMWALAIWIGAALFILSTALYMYTYKIQGIKVSLLPKTDKAEKLNVYAAFVFSFLAFATRYLRTEFGLEFAPYVCAILAAGVFFWLQSKYPTGEVERQEADHG